VFFDFVFKFWGVLMGKSIFRKYLFAVGSSLALCFSTSVFAHSAHEHGKAQIKLALDQSKMLLVLQTPQDSLVGFERAPKSEAELAKAKAASSALKEASKLFVINPEAQCSLKEVTVNAPNLVAASGSKEKSMEHTDVEANYNFECAKADQLRAIDVLVFDTFKSIKVIQVQFVGTKKQKTARLTSSARTIKF
jgi:hypothetical protein